MFGHTIHYLSDCLSSHNYMAVAAFGSISRVGFRKSDTHIFFGSGFAFPLKRLSVSSKAFKSMAALTAAPAVGISETFDILRKRGQVCGFLILVSFFSVLTFFLGVRFDLFGW